MQKAIGIPVSLFTGIFALARTVGWIAQWNEMIADPEYKIGRPRQLFIGARGAGQAAAAALRSASGGTRAVRSAPFISSIRPHRADGKVRTGNEVKR